MRSQAPLSTVAELPRVEEAVLVDLRAPADFARGHPRGAVSLPFSAQGLGQRLAVVVEPGTAIRLVTSHPTVAAAALAQLRDAYRVVGMVDGSAWHEAGLDEESFPDLPAETLDEAASFSDLTVLDVREPVEWETGCAPGAMRISLGRLRQRFDAIPRDSLVAVICEAGMRSSTGASLLQAAGFPRVATVSEGMSGYRRAGLPLEFSEP